MKSDVQNNIEKYVVKDPALPLLLDRMHANGVKTFLLTNSGFEFSNVSVTHINYNGVVCSIYVTQSAGILVLVLSGISVYQCMG